MVRAHLTPAEVLAWDRDRVARWDQLDLAIDAVFGAAFNLGAQGPVTTAEFGERRALAQQAARVAIEEFYATAR